MSCQSDKCCTLFACHACMTKAETHVSPPHQRRPQGCQNILLERNPQECTLCICKMCQCPKQIANGGHAAAAEIAYPNKLTRGRSGGVCLRACSHNAGLHLLVHRRPLPALARELHCMLSSAPNKAEVFTYCRDLHAHADLAFFHQLQLIQGPARSRSVNATRTSRLHREAMGILACL